MQATHPEQPTQPVTWPVWAALAGLGVLTWLACSRMMAAGPAQRRSVLGPVGQIGIDDGGRGKDLPVLFVHSFAGSTAHWEAQLAHLRRTRRAIALDLRGHGRSDPPRHDDYAIAQLARDIGAVTEALDLKRFVLVGHSMGGLAAATYAGAHPEQVAGLLLVGTPGRTPADEAQGILDALQSDHDKTMVAYWGSMLQGATPVVRGLLEADRQRIPREATKALVAAGFEFDPLPAITAYRGPTLLIDTPHGDGPNALHVQAPHLSRQLIEGTSHWPQLDAPEAFNVELDEFLAQLHA